MCHFEQSEKSLNLIGFRDVSIVPHFDMTKKCLVTVNQILFSGFLKSF